MTNFYHLEIQTITWRHDGGIQKLFMICMTEVLH